MYFDDEMLKIALKSYNYSDEEIRSFDEQLKSMFYELVIMHIFNYYASQHTQQEIDELEELMHQAKVFGKYEDQKKISNIIKNTIIKYPELTEQILEIQKDLQKQLLFSFLKNSDEESQIDMFSHIIQMKNFIAKKREILNNSTPINQ